MSDVDVKRASVTCNIGGHWEISCRGTDNATYTRRGENDEDPALLYKVLGRLKTAYPNAGMTIVVDHTRIVDVR